MIGPRGTRIEHPAVVPGVGRTRRRRRGWLRGLRRRVESRDHRPAPLEPRLTSDPSDPRLIPALGPDEHPMLQHDVYLVLPEASRAGDALRPVRDRYLHVPCGAVTQVHRAIAETFACEPRFYPTTYCAWCAQHRPLSEFVWVAGRRRPTGERVGV